MTCDKRYQKQSGMRAGPGSPPPFPGLEDPAKGSLQGGDKREEAGSYD